MSEEKGKNIIEFEPGEYIIQAKTASTALYIIQEGQLEVYRRDKDGHRIPIGIIGSGEYVGETALLLDRPHTSSVVCLTQVKAVRIEKSAVEAQLKAAPSWFLALTKGVIEKLAHANDILRRNGIVDHSLATKVHTLEEKSDLHIDDNEENQD